jgi:hypothetical protein
MSFAGLLNQTVILATKATYGHDGRPTFGAGADVQARLEPMQKRYLTAEGTILTLDAVMMIGASVAINADDKVTYNSINYKVVDVFAVPGQDGATHHKEVNLMLWPL